VLCKYTKPDRKLLALLVLFEEGVKRTDHETMQLALGGVHCSISRLRSWRSVRGFCSSADNLVALRALLDKIGKELGITEVPNFRDQLSHFFGSWRSL